MPLAKATLIANRQASNLNIGDVFKFTWTELGIAQLVMRRARVVWHADRRSGADRMRRRHLRPAVRVLRVPDPDIVGVAADSPAQVPYRRLGEAPWWTVVKRVVGESATAQNELDPQGGLLVACASRPPAIRSTSSC